MCKEQGTEQISRRQPSNGVRREQFTAASLGDSVVSRGDIRSLSLCAV